MTTSRTAVQGTHLDALTRLNAAVTVAQASLDATVADALAAGLSERHIAGVLGATPTAVTDRVRRHRSRTASALASSG